MTVSYQDRHHLQQEVALGARLTDLPTSSSSPQPPTKVPCPPGTEPHLPRTGSGSGSSWRQYRRRYWGPKVCRRPESLLKKGRLSVAFWEGDFPKRRGRGAHSARRSGPTAAFSGALLADLQNPRKHALLLPRNVVSIHSTLTARGGGVGGESALRKELWREAHWGREGSQSPELATLSRLCTEEAPGAGRSTGIGCGFSTSWALETLPTHARGPGN